MLQWPSSNRETTASARVLDLSRVINRDWSTVSAEA